MTILWKRLIIPESIISITEEILRSYNKGHHRNEGFVYWAGRTSGEDRIVLSTYKPRCIVTPGSVQISEYENTRFITWLRKYRLQHIGQVHSHPPGIDIHSPGDDLWAFMKYPGLISIVVPKYGLGGMRPIEKCGVHIFFNDTFHQLELNEVEKRLVIIPSCGGI